MSKLVELWNILDKLSKLGTRLEFIEEDIKQVNAKLASLLERLGSISDSDSLTR